LTALKNCHCSISIRLFIDFPRNPRDQYQVLRDRGSEYGVASA
jgi:hypothetical protein